MEQSNKNTISEEKQHLIKEFYIAGHSIKNIGRNLKCAPQTIKNILIKNNIKIRGKRKHYFNFDYFEKIDSHEKAQILGLWAADGYVKFNEFASVALAESDKEYLEKVAKYIGYNNKLRFIPKNKPDEQNQYELRLNSKKMTEDLTHLGIVQAKSLILKFPTLEQVPKEFVCSFILGYLEGDGCIYVPKMGRDIKISLTGTFEFLNKIKNIIKEILGMESQLIYISETENNTYSLLIRGAYKSVKLLDWLYKDCPFFMNRKHNEYLIVKSSIQDKIKFGLNKKGCHGETAKHSKLKAEEVLEIRNKLKNGAKQEDLAKTYNICQQTVSRIKNKTIWANLTEESISVYKNSVIF